LGGKNDIYFINGIIRKHKSKKCLEIGVFKGGSSIVILNALKDIKDSFLISLDLNSFNFFILERYPFYILL
jgi:predicted O-methyltransferase YrrM